MRVVCVPDPAVLEPNQGVAFSLFRRPGSDHVGRVAAAMSQNLLRAGVQPSPRAWDFLAISLSVAAADHGCLRKHSPDGWTREIHLTVAVGDPEFWETQRGPLEAALRFLTADIWRLELVSGGVGPPRRSRHNRRQIGGDCVCLLSGGVDSLVGAIDSVSGGRCPVLVSQISQGDGERQRWFASTVGRELSHLQLSHAIRVPGKAEASQRARSMVFLAYGVLAASVLRKHRRGDMVDLLIPENGFISLNIPLTPLRLGSLSTRTTHPFFIQSMQSILDASGFHVRLSNPYQFKTKGEMLSECADQDLLRQLVYQSTSCGRFARHKYIHCGSVCALSRSSRSVPELGHRR